MTVAADPVLCCSAGDCDYRANRIGQVTLRATPPSAAIRTETVETFWLPICDDHAHEFRAGATLVAFDSGL